jgi:hypothetical protein
VHEHQRRGKRMIKFVIMDLSGDVRDGNDGGDRRRHLQRMGDEFIDIFHVPRRLKTRVSRGVPIFEEIAADRDVLEASMV